MTTMDGEDYLSAEVLEVRAITPNLLRVRFGGPGLVDFTPTPHPDQRIHIAFPDPGEAEPAAPVIVDGLHTYPHPGPQPEIRNYTVRTWDLDTRELSVDFALHTHGLAVDWVRRARPGSVVYLNADIGWYRPPADTAWCLLLADAAGLPALARILESLPGHVTAFATIEVAEAADIQDWRSPAALDLRWLIGSGNDLGPSQLPAAVETFGPPPGPGYVWAATEASAARAIRKHVRSTWGMDHTRVDITGYWRRDQQAWLARYAQIAPEIEALWEDALSSGKSEDEAEELCDQQLEQAGL